MDRAMWVFGYGSLLWQPGFAFVEERPALLRGLHRAFCVVSHVHRGTPERPGLVAGLDHGGACRGVAFQVAPGEEERVRAYLRRREQPTMVYRETMRMIDLLGGAGGRPERVSALCFAVDRGHRQYSGRLTLAEQVPLVVNGVGKSGASVDYLDDMVASLARLGIRDMGLERLASAVREHARAAANPDAAPSAPPLAARSA